MSYNKTNIIIIGASGHAKVIIDIVERQGIYNIIGLIDSYKKTGDLIFDYKILGSERDIPSLAKEYSFNSGIIAIGDNWTRKVVYKRILEIFPEFQFVNAVHPNAVIGKNVSIGYGTVIMPGAIINSDASIGHFCIINTNSSLGHDAEINDYSSLAPAVAVSGNVKIGTCTAISLGVNIIQNIRIGKHSIIGAGSLVIEHVHDYQLVYGSPAKLIKTIKEGEKYLSKSGYKKETNES